MFRSFSRRLGFTYLIIIIAVSVFTGTAISFLLKDYLINNLKTNLTYEAVLVADMISLDDRNTRPYMGEIAGQTAKDTGMRVTIINSEGVVLADSQFDPAKMELHHTRPEVYAALRGKTGYNIRLSDTAEIKMLYVAVPFDDGTINGAVRLAKPLTEVYSLYEKMLSILLAVILGTALIAFGISIGIAKHFSRPVKDITRAVKDIAEGDLSRRAAVPSDDELGILAVAVNNMTAYLERNITEISEVKNRLEALLNNTINGIVMLDAHERITYANPVAVSLLQLPAEFAGRKQAEMIRNYDIIELADQVRQGGKILCRETLLYGATERVVEVTGVPVKDGELPHEQGGVLLVFNDITEIKRLEQVRRDFVANVSHELKTPVAVISGFAETLLAEKEESPENVNEFSQIIYDEAQRLSRLINELLELSRLEADRVELNIYKFDMVTLIEETAAIIKQRYPGANIKIQEKNIDDECLEIEADRELIAQILINLLENAVNYSSIGSLIEVIMEGSTDKVKVSVKDQGIGIPEREQKRIFERFYRVDKDRSRKTGGTGLGLSIVKHLVENHKGEVGVTSQPGAGSEFYFILPRYVQG